MTVATTVTGGGVRDVIVVGGGISGLTVAWHLRRAGVDVALLEAAEHVGGSIQTERRDGYLLEKGPFNVIVRDPGFEELLAALADRITVVTAAEQAKNRYIYRHGGIHVVPTNPLKLFHTPLFSFGGACRAVRGLFVSRRGHRDETTLEEFAARRFGQEAADTLVSAAVAGILAGDIRKLSAYACFPVLRDFDRKSFSPLGRTVRRIPAMIRKRRDPRLRRKWKGLVSIDRGLGGLCDTLADSLGRDAHVGCRVESIRATRDGFALAARGADGPREYRCRRLVLATPARETARQLEELAPVASRLLAGVESASLTVVNLAFRRCDVQHPLDGFGFLVPHNEPQFPLMGVLWADSAFPHHAPEGWRLLRVFFGGARTPDVGRRSADELVRTSCAALRDVLGVCGEPVLVDVCPYPEAIPQYYLGHEARIAAVRQHLAALPNLLLAGNYLEGVSINDCVKVGRQVANALLSVPDPVRAS
jgi:oxygen-dependent protoporphyrinogen oxidase